jgi:Leucine-rich repeat (LRR) protein
LYPQLQNNRLTSLPDGFADLTSLINLDLSHNALTSLPSHFFSLPSLSLLDLSHNSLTALPFRMPFDPATTVPAPSRRSSGFLSPPEIVRATRPLPRLTSLDASHNKIISSAIHHDSLPQDLKTFSLMYNPLSDVADLLTSLSTLTQLVVLRLSGCDIDDTSFPTTLFSSANRPTFPKLVVLDLEETRATQATVSSALSVLIQRIDFEASVTDERTVSTGTLAVAVGKHIVREAWEVEADRFVQRLRERRSAANLKDTPVSESPPPPPPPPPLPQPIQKEQWEIDAEQGLLSEGAQRRARAEAAAQRAAEDSGAVIGPTATTSASHTTPVLGRYWDSHTLTLTLPPSTGRSVRHGACASGEEESLPRVTLPLPLIITQPFADTLRTLELRGRRAEPGIVLPTSGDGSQHLLPRLETLNLEGCALSDVVPGAELADAGGTLGVLARLFPSLRNLELAYNNFTGAALGSGVLEQLLFVGGGDNSRRVGLRRLVLCGNKIEELHGLRELARIVFGAGADVANTKAVDLRGKWTLEELDVRQNSIAVLPSELGLLPLDSFLVDGNL